ncbi:MAG: FAD:protein FMN transferase [Ruminococcaceae bacterium]|nr:FAD:protein FMN transferase [Oscillospiraceae bacterium]
MLRKKRHSGFFALICCLAILFSSFCSCSFLSADKLLSFEFFDYFDTVCSLKVYADKDEAEDIEKKLKELLCDYDSLLDIYDTHGDVINLYDVNENAKKDALKVDKRLFEVLSFGKETYELTGGECNIALGSVISLWHTAREISTKDPSAAYIPSDEELKKALEHTDISALVLDADELSVSISDPELLLDCGAIAKGYVAKRAAELLDSLGCESYLINLGGNVLAKGEKSDGKLWSAAIEDADKNSKSGILCKLDLNSQTLVTSGSYQRFYTVGGKNYSHIVSNNDGMPPETFVSVSVLAPAKNSEIADALSTALFCMSLEEGKALIDSLDGVEALWVTADGEKHTSDGFEVKSWS